MQKNDNEFVKETMTKTVERNHNEEETKYTNLPPDWNWKQIRRLKEKMRWKGFYDYLDFIQNKFRKDNDEDGPGGSGNKSSS